MTTRLADLVQAHGRGLILVILSFALADIIMIPGIPISIFPETAFPRIVILANNGTAPVVRARLCSTTACQPVPRWLKQIVFSIISNSGKGL